MALANEAQNEWTNSCVESTLCVSSEDVGTPAIHAEDENHYVVYHDGPPVEFEEVITPVYQIRTHTGKRPFVCHGCNMTVAPDSRRLNHVRILGGGKPIVRHVYYMNFTKRSLSPVKGHADKPKKRGKTKKTYHCDKCERIFGHKSHFVNHQRTHSGEKPFSCSHCSKTFGQKSNLTAHVRRHLSIGKLSKKKKSRGTEEEESKDHKGTIKKEPPSLEEETDTSRERVPEKVESAVRVNVKSASREKVSGMLSGKDVGETASFSEGDIPVIRIENEKDFTAEMPLIRIKTEKKS